MKKAFLSLAMSFLLALVVIGCKKDEQPVATSPSPGTNSSTVQEPAGVVDQRKSTVDVDDIELGKSIDASKKVKDGTDDFAPADTIYASVKTDGAAANAKVTARWTYEKGTVVKEDSVNIAPGGEAWTEFHISKPGGFPKGKYNVAVMVDGKEKGNKDFEVK